MKNKKLTFFLGAVVALVWGIIIYRVISASASGDDNTNIVVKTTPKESYNDYEIPKDTMHLLLNYRDPFGLVKLKDTSDRKKHIGEKRAVLPVKPSIDWSFIKYSGYIRNPVSKKLIAILTINGKDEMMLEGETTDHVKLIKNLRDSIKIIFNGNIKFLTIHS